MPGTILNTRHLPIVVSEGGRQETHQQISKNKTISVDDQCWEEIKMVMGKAVFLNFFVLRTPLAVKTMTPCS